RENSSAVPAPAERRVDIGTAGFDRQRGHGFFEQDGDMAAISHQRENPSSSGGNPAGNTTTCSVRSSHFASSHSSNLFPCPTSTTRLLSAAYWRSAGGTRMRPAPSSTTS